MSAKIDEGGPAFPRDSFADRETGLLVQQNGMSLRDWFAGQALGHIPALLAANDKNKSVENIAAWSYQVADAMLAARKGGGK